MEYYFNSNQFKESSNYKNFMNMNLGSGILKVEAYTASLAYPLSGVLITIYKNFGSDKVIFYEGQTNESGVIESIVLPTKKMNDEINDVSDISFTTYDLDASYPKYNIEKKYDVSIFDNVKVIQPVTFPIQDLIEGEDSE